MMQKNFDAVVVGSGPNGLAAAITLQQAGISVLVMEAKETIGGGTRSAELTLPGFTHDICSAIHPLAAGSPFFQTLPLHKFGLEFIYPPISAAHPFDDGTAAVLTKSMDETANKLGGDKQAYTDLMGPLIEVWPRIAPQVLGPLQFPLHPFSLIKFGLKALPSASALAAKFTTAQARGLVAGMAAHSIQPLTNLATSAIALVLMTAGHLRGWPVAKGGSQSIANALASYFTSIGGTIATHSPVTSLNDLPKSKAVLFDVTPRQLLSIAGDRLAPMYKWQLRRFNYGMGSFKVDWALSAPIPFKNLDCRQAGTIHIGGTFEEIAFAEQQTADGNITERPYVLLAQQSLFDRSRAPEGKHTAWAYCHVPNGSTTDRTNAIEQQVERYAPGFKDTILARHTMNTAAMEAYNPNYIGGDINGGAIDITQLFYRPVLRWSPYTTSEKGIFLCSSSTPPGGGVHGMCGYYAAKNALINIFGLKIKEGLADG